MKLAGIQTIFRYYHTLKYLKLKQTIGRVWAKVKEKWIQLPEIPMVLSPQLKAHTVFEGHDPWNTSIELQNGRFVFLNKPAILGQSITEIDWKATRMPLLWQFNLHYFNYLYLFNLEERQQWQQTWIEHNPATNSVAWHPYPLSLRIINWCKFGSHDQAILRSLYQQACYLYRTLEFYHPGNHYLENARALIFAGMFFKGQGEANKWLQKGLRIFRDETPKQVLSDGGYFERTTMYHALMLEGYLDILNILPDEHQDRKKMEEVASHMLSYLNALTHPDGNLTLFNDSTQEIAPSTAQILKYANSLNIHPQEQTSFPETGYFVAQNPKWYLAVDGAPIGPDFLPAHAHADVFSYELSVDGVQFVVDSGVYEYPDGEMRRYNRSTQAHNCLTVDGLSQAECWGSFRVARRYKPQDIIMQSNPNYSIFTGVFNGFGNLLNENITHNRSIKLDFDQDTLEIIDDIHCQKRHQIQSYLHLHPEVEIEQANENLYCLTRGSISVMLESSVIPEIGNGWYSPVFGLKIPNPVFIFQTHVDQTTQIWYRFMKVGS